MNSNLVIFGSGLISAFCFWAAYSTHQRHKKGRNHRYFSGLVIGGFFAMALTVFLDSLLLRWTGHSFFKMLQSGSYVPAAIFLAGAVQGIIYEYVGSFTFDLWYYPTVRHKHFLFLVLPFFWATFMLIMQDIYALMRSQGLSTNWAFILTALLPFTLIEGINAYTKSWIYRGILKPPVALALGWFVLAFTFAVGFDKFIYSPFGF